jgi:hypothetical protein
MPPPLSAPPIPKDVAFQLGEEIRAPYQGKWYAFLAMQCFGCTIAGNGDLAKMRVSNAPGYRGCNIVNARFDRLPKAS